MSSVHTVALTTVAPHDATRLATAVNEALVNDALGTSRSGHFRLITPTLAAGQFNHLDRDAFIALLGEQRDTNGYPYAWSVAIAHENDGHWVTIHSDDFGTEYAIAFQQVPGEWVVYDETYGVFTTRQAATDRIAIEGRRYADGGDSALRLVHRAAGTWTPEQPGTRLAGITQSQIRSRRR